MKWKSYLRGDENAKEENQDPETFRKTLSIFQSLADYIKWKDDNNGYIESGGLLFEFSIGEKTVTTSIKVAPDYENGGYDTFSKMASNRINHPTRIN